jgi:hypothetical protein
LFSYPLGLLGAEEAAEYGDDVARTMV